MTTRKALALVVAFCAPAVAVVAIGARSALIDSRPVSDGVITVHAGQSGLEFNTRALSGRVALIASSTRVR